MAIDTDRLVQIANELKTLDQDREKLLAELQRIAGGIGGTPAPSARRRGRPPGSRNQAKPAVAPAKSAPAPGRKPRKGLTTDIMGLLADGNAYTAGDIVGKLGLSPPKKKIASVGATLSRPVKEGRVKKDQGARVQSGVKQVGARVLGSRAGTRRREVAPGGRADLTRTCKSCEDRSNAESAVESRAGASTRRGHPE